jgi:RNase P subunit RPR2
MAKINTRVKYRMKCGICKTIVYLPMISANRLENKTMLWTFSCRCNKCGIPLEITIEGEKDGAEAE